VTRKITGGRRFSAFSGVEVITMIYSTISTHRCWTTTQFMKHYPRGWWKVTGRTFGVLIPLLPLRAFPHVVEILQDALLDFMVARSASPPEEPLRLVGITAERSTTYGISACSAMPGMIRLLVIRVMDQMRSSRSLELPFLLPDGQVASTKGAGVDHI
jgi:hypothetical protein